MHPLEKYRLEHKMTQKELAEKIEVDPGNYNRIIKGKLGISADLKYRIKEAIGVDVMEVKIEKGKPTLYKVTDSTDFFNRLKRAKEFDDLVMSPAFSPETDENSPFIDLGNGQYNMLVPLVEEAAYAGYASGWADAQYIAELPKHSIIVDRYHKGKYFAFRVSGDSMDDGTINSIPDRSIVTGREIKRELWRSQFHIHKFKYYVIVHQDGIVIKQLIGHDTENGTITCHSLNERYEDFVLNLDECKQILNVVDISIKTA